MCYIPNNLKYVRNRLSENQLSNLIYACGHSNMFDPIDVKSLMTAAQHIWML